MTDSMLHCPLHCERQELGELSHLDKRFQFAPLRLWQVTLRVALQQFMHPVRQFARERGKLSHDGSRQCER